MERKTYSVMLSGRTYSISSGENEHYVKRIEKLTANAISETMLLDKRVNFETAAAVTALRFAEENILLQDEMTRLRRELADAAQQKD
jgi:hypothetical protein